MSYSEINADGGSGFLSLLKEAMVNHRTVHIFSTGTYKGISGKVVGINMGYVDVQETDGVEKIKLGDIKRLKVMGIKFTSELKEEKNDKKD